MICCAMSVADRLWGFGALLCCSLQNEVACLGKTFCVGLVWFSFFDFVKIKCVDAKVKPARESKSRRRMSHVGLYLADRSDQRSDIKHGGHSCLYRALAKIYRC